mmetsp:Transcript_24673/g.69078  ORF Transcript_24673/g.69078 Transcript_24673/m.69078 type:complete len:284 (-) Transcript_24673:712-1563(-)
MVGTGIVSRGQRPGGRDGTLRPGPQARPLRAADAKLDIPPGGVVQHDHGHDSVGDQLRKVLRCDLRRRVGRDLPTVRPADERRRGAGDCLHHHTRAVGYPKGLRNVATYFVARSRVTKGDDGVLPLVGVDPGIVAHLLLQIALIRSPRHDGNTGDLALHEGHRALKLRGEQDGRALVLELERDVHDMARKVRRNVELPHVGRVLRRARSEIQHGLGVRGAEEDQLQGHVRAAAEEDGAALAVQPAVGKFEKLLRPTANDVPVRQGELDHRGGHPRAVEVGCNV